MQIQRSFVLVLIIEWMYSLIRVVPPETFGPYRGAACPGVFRLRE